MVCICERGTNIYIVESIQDTFVNDNYSINMEDFSIICEMLGHNCH